MVSCIAGTIIMPLITGKHDNSVGSDVNKDLGHKAKDLVPEPWTHIKPNK